MKVLLFELNGVYSHVNFIAGIEVLQNILLNGSIDVDVYDVQLVNPVDLKSCFIYHKDHVG